VLRNVGGPEIVILVIGLGLVAGLVALLVLWVMGIVKLFQKNQTTLAWIALAGIVIPLVGLVGFAGWFVEDRSGTI